MARTSRRGRRPLRCAGGPPDARLATAAGQWARRPGSATWADRGERDGRAAERTAAVGLPDAARLRSQRGPASHEPRKRFDHPVPCTLNRRQHREEVQILSGPVHRSWQLLTLVPSRSTGMMTASVPCVADRPSDSSVQHGNAMTVPREPALLQDGGTPAGRSGPPLAKAEGGEESRIMWAFVRPATTFPLPRQGVTR